MCRKVIKRKNKVITSSLSDGLGNTKPIFYKNIHLQFQPDTMTVKSIVYCGVADPTSKKDDIRLIWCTNLNECIGSFYDGSTSTPNLTFDVKNATFNSEWGFRSQDYDGALDSTSDGSRAIHLEFLQHED